LYCFALSDIGGALVELLDILGVDVEVFMPWLESELMLGVEVLLFAVTICSP
jgi:hypothetical protein